MTAVREGALRLLQIEDLEPGKLNAGGKPLVGWRSTSEGVGHINPNGWAIFRGVIQKLVDGQLRDLYDQFFMIENPGSVVICIAGKGESAKVGLIQNYRMVGERLSVENPSKYVAGLDEGRRWSEALEMLGQKCWEAPRGLIPPSDNVEELNAFVLKTAKLEAAQEAGFIIGNAKVVGRSNPNSTFFANAQYVVVAEIVGQGENKPEEFEFIGNVRLFSKPEIRKMISNGEFTDGMALAAMSVAGFHF